VKKIHLGMFLLGWAFAMVFPPSHLVAMFRSKQS